MLALNPAARHPKGHVTSEAVWQAWPGLLALPEVAPTELVPAGSRAVIVAPHSDDELFGAGGLMMQLDRLGREMLIVTVTDGPSARSSANRWRSAPPASEPPLESRRSLSALGLDHVPSVRVGLAHGSIGVNAIKLIEALCRQLRPTDVVLTTWRFDGLPDHEATGRACAACALNVGAKLVEMPIWSWHWAEPGDPRLPWPRACRLPLPFEVEQGKRRAAEAFADFGDADLTQTTSSAKAACLPPSAALTGALRPYEVFFR